jgi:16S rRNA (cytidine1402-2'-O)-methyltransferase
MAESSIGVLSIVPTPIGNMGDITLRALEVLKNADIIACEDTRRTGQLLKKLEITDYKLVKFFEHNESAACGRLVEDLLGGKNIALVTDGGTPSISDPGYRIVNAARDEDIKVEALPGACACVVGLVASGLRVASFTFRGFPPRKPGKLRNFLSEELTSKHTQIFYESPYRLIKFLEAALEVYGNRRASVCRELTKLHEEVNTAKLEDLITHYSNAGVKGEVTVIVEGLEKE